MMITRTLKTDNTPNRLRSGGFDENLRFIHILELLKPNQDVELSQMTRMLSDISGSSVGTFNKLVSEEKPSKMTLEHIKKIKKIIPFLDSNYIMYENDPITGKAINPFIRELTEEDKNKFKPKKNKPQRGIDRDRCERIRFVRMRHDETQASFADRLGIQRYIVSSIEGSRQNPTLDFIALLKTKMNIDPWWIISGEGEMQINYDQSEKSELDSLREKVKTLEKIIEKLID